MPVRAPREAGLAATPPPAPPPPSASPSPPASTVAGCPAAIAASTCAEIVTLSAQVRHPHVRICPIRSQWGGGWWPPGRFGPDQRSNLAAEAGSGELLP